MKMKYFRFILFGLIIIALAAKLTSCNEDEDTISIVNFEEEIYNLNSDDLGPLEVVLSLEPASSGASEITIEATGADAGTVFTTNPPISGTTITVPVPAGATSVSFTFTPIAAALQGENVVVNLELSGTGSGLTTGLVTESVITIVDVGESLPLNEDFSGCNDDPAQPIPNDWTEAVIEQNGEGSARWECTDESFFGFNAIQVNAFVPGSNDTSPSEVWLITPRLNLTETTSPVLNFDVDRRFGGTGAFPEPLYDILISSDYTVSVENATWTRFQPGFDAMTANDPGTDGLSNSGDLDLSAFNGETIAIAFVYRAGAPASFDATILRIANVSVTDN